MTTIYYVEGTAIGGGVKQSYRHVDILNRNGYRAFIVHPGLEKATWFENQTKTISLKQLQNQFKEEQDIIVVDEASHGLLKTLPGRKVIFNQNMYFGFSAITHENFSVNPIDAIAILTVSKHNERYLRFAYP